MERFADPFVRDFAAQFERFLDASMIDVGLIGFGLAGRSFHAPVIRAVPGLRLAAILERSGNAAAAQYPDVPIVRTLDELLANPEIRLVVIATPNDSHYPIARECLRAGRDVLVDKPFATTLQEAIALVEFAEKQGRLLTVYQNRRYDGDFQAIVELVRSGALGRVVRFESNYDRFRPQLRPGAWRERAGPGSGIFFDLAPHLIDHALLLFGMPRALTADIRIEREGAVADDAFDLAFHYPGGLRADLRSSILAVTTRPRFLLHGTQGGFVKQCFDPQEGNLRRGYIPTDTSWGAEPQENWGLLTLFENGALTERRVPSAKCDYRDFYANLREAMLGKAKLAVSPEWALEVMRLLELARHSSKERRTVAVPVIN